MPVNKTYADCFREMTDEQLAEAFTALLPAIVFGSLCSAADGQEAIKESWLNWLRQEAKDASQFKS